MGKYMVRLVNIAGSIGKIADLVDERLTGHHRRVAYIAGRLAEAVNLPLEEQDEVVLAGLMHDIGGLSTKERLDIIDFYKEPEHHHAESGYKLLALFKPFNQVGELIRYHHVCFKEGIEQHNHIGAHILYMADRIDVLVASSHKHILLLADEVRAYITSGCNEKFMPELVEAFLKISSKEAFWLDSIGNVELEPKSEKYKNTMLYTEDMIELGLFFSQIIDFRCNFTATHSSGIAAVSSELARLYGFSERECTLMRFAGYVHDIGKLAVPIEIIEKQGKLNEEEGKLIRMHTYYTYQILSGIEGLDQVREWAAYHHEKNDGTGYPFGLSGDEISEGCKIMKVADIFTALREERPYRLAMKKEKVLHIFECLEKEDETLSSMISCLKANYDELDKVRAKAQEEAAKRYKAFIE